MGTQFGGAESRYDATWTVDWKRVVVGELADKEDNKEDSSNGNNGLSNENNKPSNGNNGITNETTNGANNNTDKETTNKPQKGTVISIKRLSELKAGSYGLNASLSCYVNAMGGVEFGNALLSNAVLKVTENGSATITLTFKTSSVTIYGIDANTYMSSEGKVQYWNGTSWVNASYTKDANGYVSTMTFPIEEISNTYKLALMVGSDVMGAQFGGEGSNYDATLTVDWSYVVVDGSGTPQTGDMAPILPIVAGMVFSVVLFGWVMCCKKKEQM